MNRLLLARRRGFDNDLKWLHTVRHPERSRGVPISDISVVQHRDRTNPFSNLIGDGAPKKRKVLVTDDSRVYLEMMKRVIESWGYEVVIHLNKIEALEKLREIKTDLVITDLCSPEMFGLDFIRWVKRIDPSVPVIIVSGNAENLKYVREAVRLGVIDCFKKPFDVSALRGVIERALKTRS